LSSAHDKDVSRRRRKGDEEEEAHLCQECAIVLDVGGAADKLVQLARLRR
jgi:hypothetical protein